MQIGCEATSGAQHGTPQLNQSTPHNACQEDRKSRCENVEEGDGTLIEDWTIQEPMPLHAVHVRQTVVEDNPCNTSEGLWKAPSEEAPAAGNLRASVVW